MQKSAFPPTGGLYPVPVVLVSSTDKSSGKSNIITIAWCGMACSEPPQLTVSIRPSRYSHKLIKETGDFVVNVPRSSIIRKIDLCGIKSGRDIDKFEACSFTKLASSKVASPSIQECPVNIECTLNDIVKLGTHDMFIGEVLAVRVDNSILGPKNNIDYLKADPIVFNQGEYWSLGKRLGSYGFSAKVDEKFPQSLFRQLKSLKNDKG